MKRWLIYVFDDKCAHLFAIRKTELQAMRTVSSDEFLKFQKDKSCQVISLTVPTLSKGRKKQVRFCINEIPHN
jgi:hypothetical protein